VYQRDPDTEPEERGEDRHAHGDDRAEREQQDDHGGDETDEVGVALGLPIRVVDDRAAVGETDTGVRRGRGRIAELVVGRERELLRLRVVLHRDERDLPGVVAALRDDQRTERTVRIGHAHDVRDLAEGSDARLDRGLHGRVVDAVTRVEHDRRGRARLAREPLLQQIERDL
jgi:hypothetical protein